MLLRSVFLFYILMVVTTTATTEFRIECTLRAFKTRHACNEQINLIT